MAAKKAKKAEKVGTPIISAISKEAKGMQLYLHEEII